MSVGRSLSHTREEERKIKERDSDQMIFTDRSNHKIEVLLEVGTIYSFNPGSTTKDDC